LVTCQTPLLAVDQQVEARMDEIRHVGRRNALVVRRQPWLAAPDRGQPACQEVVLVPRPEEGGGADHERRLAVEHHALLSGELAASVGVQRVGTVALQIRRLLFLAVEHEVAGERHQPHAAALAFGGEHRGAERVFAPLAIVVLGVVDANVAGSVDHRPRRRPVERATDRRGVGDVHVGTRQQPERNAAVLADARERAAQRPGRTDDQQRVPAGVSPLRSRPCGWYCRRPERFHQPGTCSTGMRRCAPGGQLAGKLRQRGWPWRRRPGVPQARARSGRRPA
jgi:hypothetical protein